MSLALWRTWLLARARRAAVVFAGPGEALKLRGRPRLAAGPAAAAALSDPALIEGDHLRARPGAPTASRPRPPRSAPSAPKCAGGASAGGAAPAPDAADIQSSCQLKSKRQSRALRRPPMQPARPQGRPGKKCSPAAAEGAASRVPPPGSRQMPHATRDFPPFNHARLADIHVRQPVRQTEQLLMVVCARTNARSEMRVCVASRRLDFILRAKKPRQGL